MPGDLRKACRLPLPPLTAPAVSPATLCLRATMLSMRTGSVTTRAAAASGPQLTFGLIRAIFR